MFEGQERKELWLLKNCGGGELRTVELMIVAELGRAETGFGLELGSGKFN